ncbi:HupE/UreJ family protein [Cryobacterium sp. TMT1-3]|uniref:HupE/UreJ family protein n=1 Tax=Cryobacterium luteum TaxID=1424661 RepID=A0A1H8F775_9MICO|nr:MULTISPECIES: HupE/UreJ family protein [Cryobacterium]TFB85513.1 HupE/UreJ family protein [Cryobacterium luteum]TFC26582.1 HupE/UreJ family protein [Cryobacterium sp. TMT1-3]SEN26888.1 HupE / UreJ protein [Cryobacterium luteum]
MLRRVLVVVLVALAVLIPAAPAMAHNYAATVFVEVTEPEPGLVRTVLDLEYVLLAVDGAEAMGDAAFERDAYADVQSSGQDPGKLTPRILEQYSDTVSGYVLSRWSVAPEVGHGEPPTDACTNTLAAPYEIVLIENVPHARIVVDSDCRALVGVQSPVYRISTELFPGTEPGGKTTTVVSYDLRSGSGVANLDTDTNSTMTTNQDWGSRMWEFFVLGGEHLLFGLDHFLFLLALIVGSRRLRDILLAATAFTVAHSVTFIFAALGIVSVPAFIVEPIIALSIAVVAIWYLWGVWRRGRTDAWPAARGVPAAAMPRSTPGDVPRTGAGAVLERAAVVETDEPARRRALGMTSADWLRVAVVFAFGLIHGVGFAGALGIDEPLSWGLLGALLVFNVGIEVVQIAIIVVLFPLLVLLRKRIPAVGLWVGIAVCTVVAVVGLYWFVERVLAGG